MAQWEIRSAEDLGRAIAGLRSERGLTQAELAGEIGLDRTYLAKVEAGRSSRLLDLVLRLVRRLGATVLVVTDDDA